MKTTDALFDPRDAIFILHENNGALMIIPCPAGGKAVTPVGNIRTRVIALHGVSDRAIDSSAIHAGSHEREISFRKTHGIARASGAEMEHRIDGVRNGVAIFDGAKNNHQRRNKNDHGRGEEIPVLFDECRIHEACMLVETVAAGKVKHAAIQVCSLASLGQKTFKPALRLSRATDHFSCRRTGEYEHDAKTCYSRWSPGVEIVAVVVYIS